MPTSGWWSTRPSTAGAGRAGGHGSAPDVTRWRLARDAFAHTAAYDAAIVGWFDGASPGLPRRGVGSRHPPPTIHLTLERAGSLRYGENPHQHGARYRIAGEPSWWDGVVQYGGKALSYLNLFDADAAWRLVHELADSAPRSPPPSSSTPIRAGPRWPTPWPPPTSGPWTATRCLPSVGIVALSGPVTVAGGRGDRRRAPGRRDHRPLLRRSRPRPAAAKRKATRLLSAPPRSRHPPVPGDGIDRPRPGCRPLPGADPSLGVVTTRASRPTPSGATWCWPGRSAGAPPPTPSPSSATARRSGWGPASVPGGGGGDRGHQGGRPGPGRAAASDAFFPFPDGLEVLAAAGVAVVVQPGGSVSDAEVTAAADAAGHRPGHRLASATSGTDDGACCSTARRWPPGSGPR